MVTELIQTTPDLTRYRPNAGVILLNENNRLFYAERADIPGAWQLPQGGIDPGEDPRTAATRELFEETAIHQLDLVAEYPHWLVYDFPSGAVKTDAAKARFHGQAQKWFMARFTGTDADIDLAQAAHHEFIDWRWALPEEILRTTVAFRQPIYGELFKHFGLMA